MILFGYHLQRFIEKVCLTYCVTLEFVQILREGALSRRDQMAVAFGVESSLPHSFQEES